MVTARTLLVVVVLVGVPATCAIGEGDQGKAQETKVKHTEMMPKLDELWATYRDGQEGAGGTPVLPWMLEFRAKREASEALIRRPVVIAPQVDRRAPGW